MKKNFSISFTLSLLYFFSFHIQANPIGGKLSCWFPFLKKKPVTILEEFNNNPELAVRSTVMPYTGYHIGYELHPYLMAIPTATPLRTGEVKYSFIHIPAKSRRGKGVIALLLRVHVSSAEYYYDYQHWIHWESGVKKPHLNESTIEAIFNKVYEDVYGESLDWMIRHEIIQSMVSYGVKNNLTHFGLYDIFNFNSLLFKDAGDNLRQLVGETIKLPGQERKASETTDFLSNSKMGSLMKRVVFGSRSTEELQNLSPERIRSLTLEDMLLLYDTAEKIQSLDMSLLSPEMAVTLLSGYRTWREVVTPAQVQQLDVRADGIQHIFAPTFKYFSWEPKSEVINVDTLSDKQVMSMDRDTFLRDVFLAGELYVQGHVPPNVYSFMLSRKIAIRELGYETVMKGSLPKYLHDFILKKLGFEMSFEDMTPQQRRELFKKEIEMMTDIRQQIDIIEDVAVVAATASHIMSHPESLNEGFSP